ncbi:MAG: S8 family serine peptidase [Burkholderiales bacterium]
MRPGALLRAAVLPGLIALIAITLVGCSNSSNSSAPSTTISAGKNCDLSYSLTQSAVLTGPDPLLGEQWHLTNTGQNGGTPGEDLRAAGAWAITRGAGVRVAVIDDSIEVTHPDLYPNLVQGASRSYRNGNRGSVWPVPCLKAEDDHGTAVAGLVLARDGNAIGVVGVASRASLVAYDALSTSYDIDIADALTRDSQLNSVYQNSWGSPDNGQLHPADAVFTAAITSGLVTGRQGKGSIYVFAGGNGGCYLIDEKTGKCQVDNSNFDGYVNQRGIVTVCAVDDNGVSPWYGEPGATLTVCAPSSGSNPVGVTTTAINGSYESTFSGTSASTPMVSGVIALMLSVNPSLTWRDARIILARSARRNNPTDTGWLPAAGGLQFNHKYGFGVANAQAAVALAGTWSSVGGSASMKTCESPLRTPNLPLPDAASDGTSTPVSDSLSIAGCDITSIEFVEIFFTASHTYSGDLKVTVTSPAAAVSQLANARLCKGNSGDACGPYDDWRFGSMRHLGEAANGNWTLTVTDMSAGDTGRFDAWNLKIYGH